MYSNYFIVSIFLIKVKFVVSSLWKFVRTLISHSSPQSDGSARSTWPWSVCQVTHQFTFVASQSHYHILLHRCRGVSVLASYPISCYRLGRTRNFTSYRTSRFEWWVQRANDATAWTNRSHHISLRYNIYSIGCTRIITALWWTTNSNKGCQFVSQYSIVETTLFRLKVEVLIITIHLR